MDNEVIAQIAKQAGTAAPLGGTLKFVLDGHPIFIDGTGDSNVVSAEDKEADCVMTTSLETLMKVKAGEINPMMAVMTQQITLKGNMGIAMKLQSLIV